MNYHTLGLPTLIGAGGLLGFGILLFFVYQVNIRDNEAMVQLVKEGYHPTEARCAIKGVIDICHQFALIQVMETQP